MLKCIATWIELIIIEISIPLPPNYCQIEQEGTSCVFTLQNFNDTNTLFQEFGVLEPVQDGSDAVMERIGLLEDMRWEKEQQDMLAALIADAPPTPIAMDEVITTSSFN